MNLGNSFRFALSKLKIPNFLALVHTPGCLAGALFQRMVAGKT
jgi:hypothetical protein